MSFIEILGVVGVVILNFATVPQIIRVVRLDDGRSISITACAMCILGLGIMYINAWKEQSLIFMINYTLALGLELILLFVTLLTRKTEKK